MRPLASPVAVGIQGTPGAAQKARDSARARLLVSEAPWCGTGDAISWGPAPLNVDPCSTVVQKKGSPLSSRRKSTTSCHSCKCKGGAVAVGREPRGTGAGKPPPAMRSSNH